MLSGSCYGYAIQNFKEVKIKGTEQRIGGAFLYRKFAPGVERLLSLLKNILNGLLGIQLGIDVFGVAFIGNRKLIFKSTKRLLTGVAESISTLVFTPERMTLSISFM